MNSAQLIYRGKLRLSFDIPFLDTPFYLHTSHFYASTLFYVFSCGSACGSARASTCLCFCLCLLASSSASLCMSYGGLGIEV